MEVQSLCSRNKVNQNSGSHYPVPGYRTPPGLKPGLPLCSQGGFLGLTEELCCGFSGLGSQKDGA